MDLSQGFDTCYSRLYNSISFNVSRLWIRCYVMETTANHEPTSPVTHMVSPILLSYVKVTTPLVSQWDGALKNLLT